MPPAHQLGPDDAEIVKGAGIPEVPALDGEPQRLRRVEPADSGVEGRQDHAPRARQRIVGTGGIEQLSQRVRRRRPGHPAAEGRKQARSGHSALPSSECCVAVPGSTG
jgi:hypothetical protein